MQVSAPICVNAFPVPAVCRCWSVLSISHPPLILKFQLENKHLCLILRIISIGDYYSCLELYFKIINCNSQGFIYGSSEHTVEHKPIRFALLLKLKFSSLCSTVTFKMSLKTFLSDALTYLLLIKFCSWCLCAEIN